jgi:hypothetical protein
MFCFNVAPKPVRGKRNREGRERDFPVPPIAVAPERRRFPERHR